MEQYIDKAAVLAEIEKVISGLRRNYNPNPLGNMQECLAAAEIEALNLIKDSLNTLEVKEVDINKISENLAKADEYLGYTHTSNLVHNMPMIVARLRGAIKELYNAKLFQLTNNVEYRMERLGLKAQKGE